MSGEQAASVSGATSPPPPLAGPRQVTPLELVGAGASVLSLGALAGFLGQQSGSAKQLAEDGIDPRVRLRFLPVAAKALAASSLVCVGLGALAAGAWTLAGLQFQSVAQVASWEDALALAKQQRQVISALFKEQLHRPPDDSSGSGGGGSGGGDT